MITWQAKYDMLAEAERKVADAIMNAALDTLACKEGTIVILTDALGSGHADFFYGGNVLLVEPLLEAGATIGQEYFATGKGTMQ